MVAQLSQSSIEKATTWYTTTMTDENRVVRDDKITVRGRAMKMEGYMPVTHPSGCIITGSCPVCRKTRFKYTKQNVIYWDCPTCEKIT